MKKAILGAAILLFILIFSLAFSFFPIDVDLSKSFLGPNPSAPFGYDSLGRNLFLEVARGVVISFSIALLVSLISIVLGLLAAYLMSINRVAFSILNVVCNSFKVMPVIVLALFLASVKGPSVPKLIIALSLAMVSNVARTMLPRLEVARKESYMDIARGFGIPEPRIFIFHGIPALLAYIREELLSIMVSSILLESSLSYLGCGVGVSTPTIGSLLSDSRPYFFSYPHLIVFPALVLFLLSLSLSLISSGLRDISKLDPAS